MIKRIVYSLLAVASAALLTACRGGLGNLFDVY